MNYNSDLFLFVIRIIKVLELFFKTNRQSQAHIQAHKQIPGLVSSSLSEC